MYLVINKKNLSVFEWHDTEEQAKSRITQSPDYGIVHLVDGCLMDIRERSIKELSDKNQELLECVQNLMGVFDNPIARRRIEGNIVEEARMIGRNILEEYENENK
jgi:hypothetical protein